MILNQQDRDNAVQDLLNKLSEVYTFMNGDGRLAEIDSMQELFGKLARQTLECTDFIIYYSETKSACKSSAPRRCRHLTPSIISCTGERLAKNVFKETSALIQRYNDVLDTLMQRFRDGVVRDIVVNVHRFGKSWPRCTPNPG